MPACMLTTEHYYMQVKEVGIVLGHGSNAADWNGKFLTELAAALAAEGDNCADVNVNNCSALFLTVL